MVAMVYFVSAKLFVRDVNIFDKLSAESLSEIENTRRFDIMSEAAGYFQVKKFCLLQKYNVQEI